MNPPDDSKLERLIHRTLRDLPAPRAPRTLEQRVQAELERRAALPWWKRSFAHWPMPLRMAFVAVALGLVFATWTIGTRMVGGVEPIHAQPFLAGPLAWVEAGATLLRALGDSLGAALRSVPRLWLYGGLAVIAALYTALVGLGAAAYRTLYTHS